MAAPARSTRSSSGARSSRASITARIFRTSITSALRPIRAQAWAGSPAFFSLRRFADVWPHGMSMEQRFSGQIMQRDVDPAARQATLGEIGINQFAPYLMNRIMERWNGNLAEALKLHNMSTTMMRALAVLSISSPVTINELSAYAVTEQSTMSRTLDSLEAQGLVRRQRRPEDMRIRDVSITEEGRAAFERVWPMMHARFQTLFDGVEEEEYRAFTATLLKILRNVAKLPE